MKYKLQKHIAIFGLILIVICTFIVTLSPRFGRCIDGIDSSLKNSKYILDKTRLINDSVTAVYVNDLGEFITISYSSRFFGDITIGVDDDKSITMKNIRFDGSYTGENNNNAEYGSNAYMKIESSAYSIISNDSGAFYFIHYLIPIVFVGLFTLFMRKSFKTESEKVARIYHILAAVSFILVFLFAFRVI